LPIEEREQILRRFESWLDDVLSSEEPPQGIAAEILARLQNDGTSHTATLENGRGDMYSIWSALTALTQETKLQGRAFKQLHEKITPAEALGNSIASVLAAQEELLTTTRRIAEDARTLHREQEEKAIEAVRHQVQEEILHLLLDVRDRLIRGLESAHSSRRELIRAPKRNWLARVIRKRRPGNTHAHAIEVTEALIKGYEIGLMRLDEALKQLGVSEIICIEQPFDPKFMTAVDIEETAQVPEGTVLEVYRTGYQWQERILRTAQVKVARQCEKQEEI
jgi:molecular chaperone GrpE